jgi:hypothetical protein
MEIFPSSLFSILVYLQMMTFAVFLPVKTLSSYGSDP